MFTFQSYIIHFNLRNYTIKEDKLNNITHVLKLSGKLEPYQPEKVNKVLEWAGEGLDVSFSAVAMGAAPMLESQPRTSDIHEALIKAAVDLIEPANSDYQFLAGRLVMLKLRKMAYRQYTPPKLQPHTVKMVDLGWYDKHLLEDYGIEEFDYFDSHIDHDRDLHYTYAAMEQWRGKYLVQDRTNNGRVFESPQIAIMLIAMCLFADRENRNDKIVKFYDAVSKGKISLPTPIMAGVRTPTRQFSSCVLIESDDTLDSINATTSAIVSYVSKRAGIGINGGAIRAVGSKIRSGEMEHTGVIPFWKMFQAAVKSCSQGGIRGGAATLFYPLWHLEVESLLVLKNNRGTEDNRIRQIDYGVQLNKLMYTRLMKKGDITLFSPDVADGKLYKYFFEDQDRFEALYLALEKDPTVRKSVVPAIDLFTSLVAERAQTGRVYIQNVDHTNEYGPFDPKVAPIRQSNLCLEIALPTQPMASKEEEIALCTLSAFNVGTITLEELPELAALVVEALDSLLDYQDYMVKAALKNKLRRTLGVGIIGYAHLLAKNGFKYSDPRALALTHTWFEAIQFHLMKASMNLAKEQGPCGLFRDTDYSKGIMPIDNYKKSIDSLGTFELEQDWDTLRSDILKYGMRNSTLTALMPSETSSQISNATSGIEPPKSAMTIKASKDGTLKQLVPDVENLFYEYDYLWDIPSNTGYLNLVGIMQKFVDQAISANTNYDPARFEGNKVPAKLILQDLILAYRNGLKTLYYHNTRDGAGEGEDSTEVDAGCDSGGCKI